MVSSGVGRFWLESCCFGVVFGPHSIPILTYRGKQTDESFFNSFSIELHDSRTQCLILNNSISQIIDDNNEVLMYVAWYFNRYTDIAEEWLDGWASFRTWEP